MEEQNKWNDLNVAGISQTAGGEFHRVSNWSRLQHQAGRVFR
ncbi:hypothetical protein [Paenibacillus polymyxa]|nr:hypothetical protein [Paenibacillus polymyxa]